MSEHEDISESLEDMVQEGLMETKTVIRDGRPVNLYRLTAAGKQRAAELVRQLADNEGDDPDHPAPGQRDGGEG